MKVKLMLNDEFTVNGKLKRGLLIITFLAFITIMISLYTNSYFVHKEIMYATNMCFENNGFPIVRKGFLSINWSVTCEK